MSNTASPEDALRALDQADAEAVLAKDDVRAETIYDADFLLHFAPAKVVRSRAQVLNDMRRYPAFYDTFVRTTEFVSVQDSFAITVGSEAAVATSAHKAHASGPIQRRYSHVWRKCGEDWKLLFRHVNAVD